MKILLVRTGAMGDVIHALPAVAALRRARPDWTLDWVVDPRWAPLLTAVDSPGANQGRGGGLGPVVDHVHLAETKLWSKAPISLATLRSIRRLRSELRSNAYDLAVDLQGTLRSAIIGRFANAVAFAGFSAPREPLAARLYSQRIPRTGEHIVAMNTQLLGAATGVDLQPEPFALPVEPWAEDWAEREAVLRRPLALLAAGGGWAAKHWPNARYGRLAQELQTRGYDVVVNAPRKDDPTALTVASASQGAARTVVCNVSGLIALVRRVDLVVGGDTGPLHLAAGLAVPTVALFGPTSPERNGPWGPGPKIILRDAASPTSYRKSSEPDPGLARITVEQVLAAVTEVAAPPPQPSI
ncbi:heptosyltransferase-1 [Bryocella elongata]|uniref:Lipopolysaccharide heptosyltransferase 1 n=1 Tax=Bryocella elongata TaxID=863522 RepID=A0A1H6AJB8_9BACT|nr:lipopolysaccharide heptosyltransferase I [Bryocella elongata]SEG48853.1 heptosyltransferase-1 [Bryocella elongata]